MSRQQWAREISNQLGIPYKDVRTICMAIVDRAARELAANGRTWTELGRLEIKRLKRKSWTHPQTGQVFTDYNKDIIKLKPSVELKRRTKHYKDHPHELEHDLLEGLPEEEPARGEDPDAGE